MWLSGSGWCPIGSLEIIPTTSWNKPSLKRLLRAAHLTHHTEHQGRSLGMEPIPFVTWCNGTLELSFMIVWSLMSTIWPFVFLHSTMLNTFAHSFYLCLCFFILLISFLVRGYSCCHGIQDRLQPLDGTQLLAIDLIVFSEASWLNSSEDIMTEIKNMSLNTDLGKVELEFLAPVRQMGRVLSFRLPDIKKRVIVVRGSSGVADWLFNIDTWPISIWNTLIDLGESLAFWINQGLWRWNHMKFMDKHLTFNTPCGFPGCVQHDPVFCMDVSLRILMAPLHWRKSRTSGHLGSCHFFQPREGSLTLWFCHSLELHSSIPVVRCASCAGPATTLGTGPWANSKTEGGREIEAGGGWLVDSCTWKVGPWQTYAVSIVLLHAYWCILSLLSLLSYYDVAWLWLCSIVFVIYKLKS